MNKSLREIMLFLTKNEIYKIESDIFLDRTGDKFIKLTALNDESISIISDHVSQLYEIINENYKKRFIEKFEQILAASSHIELKCNFNESQKHYKPFVITLGNEVISNIDVSFFKNEVDYDLLLYIIDRLFDEEFDIDYNYVYDEFGRKDLTKRDFYSYSLISKGKKLSINNISENMDLEIKEMINKRKKEKRCVKRYGKDS